MASDIGINLTLTADAGQAKSELQSLTHAASSFNTEMRSAETVNPYKASAMALQQAQQNSPDKASAMALQQAQQNSPDKASAMALQQAQQQSVMQKFGSFFRPKTPITVDTTQAKTQIEELSRIIEDLTEKMKKALEVGDGRSAGSLSIALQNATTARRTLMAQVNQAQTTQPRLDSNAAWVIQQSMTQITRGILSSMDAALSAATQRASGDYTGAAVTKRRATGEIWGQGIGTAAGVGIGALLTPLLGPMAIPLVAGISGEIGKFLGGKDAKKMEESLAYSAQYKQALPAIDSLNQIYGGDIGRKLAVENNRAGLSMYERAGEAARGTGLS
ncbi:MAG: hypothetical protein LBL64_10005, partial [Treponema sp.]|nr:hypothetical protein [Treponema sp.]